MISSRIMLRGFSLTAALLTACAWAAPLPARAGASVETGYVVRVDGLTVYLDFGRDARIEAGDRFAIYREGEELKHPVTGEALGRLEEKLAEGVVESVLEKYSTGKLSGDGSGVAPGVRFRLLDRPRRGNPALPPESAREENSAAARKPYYRSPLLDIEAADVALGDADADGAEDLVLIGPAEVRVYPFRQDGKKWTPSCAYKNEATGVRYLSVEAADLDKDGRAEIFATNYSSFFKRVETQVLECRDGSLREKAVIPWLVRSYQKPDGAWTVGAQQLVADKTFPFASIYELAYKDGRYEAAGPAVKHKRLEWLYGFSFTQRENPAGTDEAMDPFLLFYNDAGRLRAQYKRGSWLSREKYGQTSQRITWFDQQLQFFPRMIVEHSSSGMTGLYTLKNIAGLFNLASPFGIFKSSELHYLRWNGMSLEPAWKTDLTGYAAGIAEKRSDDTLVIAVRGVEEHSSVWFYRK